MNLPKYMVLARARAVEGRIVARAAIPSDVLQRRIVWADGARDVRNASQAPKTATLFVYEPIGQGFWGDEGCTARDVVAALDAAKKAGCSSVDVRIHSEGGDLFDGFAMFNALKRCGMSTTAFNDGLCASAATIVAMGCNKVVAGHASEWMSHRAWSIKVGNSDDMQSMSDLLKKLDGQIADLYSARTGKSSAECLAMMEAGADGQGSWMTPEECKAFGFADEIADEDKGTPTEADDGEQMNATKNAEHLATLAAAAAILADEQRAKERAAAAKARANAATDRLNKIQTA